MQEYITCEKCKYFNKKVINKESVLYNCMKGENACCPLSANILEKSAANGRPLFKEKSKEDKSGKSFNRKGRRRHP